MSNMVTTIQIPINQLHIEQLNDWSTLLSTYTVWRFRLSDSQWYHARKVAPRYFYERFTNAYKKKFDQPFYYFTNDEPQAALYTFLPHGHTPEPWLFPFGNQEQEIVGEPIAPDEVVPHVMLKLMMALCFFEAGLKEQQQRVCQSKFFMRVRGGKTSDFITAIEYQPSVADVPGGHLMTLKVKVGLFVKAISEQQRSYTETGTYYELFVSHGQAYLRQIRPDLVATFKGDLYQPRTGKSRKPQANWHNNGATFKEGRSYLIRHFQERFSEFLATYGFLVSMTEETMTKQKTQEVALPLHRLPTVQVFDNRINQERVPLSHYLGWLRTYAFETTDGKVPLSFEPVDRAQLSAEKPLLVLLDAEADAFGIDEEGKPGLLAAQGIDDPYQQLYREIPHFSKQSLNVNLNKVADFTQADHYLTYTLPQVTLANDNKPGEADEADSVTETDVADLTGLSRNLEVCLSELWLKWVVAGRADCSTAANCLPYSSQLTDDWGFMTDDLLLYFDNQRICFADLSTPEGKGILKERFTGQSEIRRNYMERTRYNEDRTNTNLPKAHFVLTGNQVFEIECTDAIAMPNWPEILRIKADNPKESARTRKAINVYAGGIWYNSQTQRYIVGGTDSMKTSVARGHHVYQIHAYNEPMAGHLSTLLSLLTVTFVRKNQYTVWPYPFDLIRLKREMLSEVVEVGE